MNHCLGTDSHNLFGVVSQSGDEKPVVHRIEPKMIDAPFYIRQGDGSGQHERSSIRRSRVLLSTHYNSVVSAAISKETRPRPQAFVSATFIFDNLAQLSSMPKDQSRYRRAGYKNRLGNLPAKQYGETHRTDQYGRQIVN